MEIRLLVIQLENAFVQCFKTNGSAKRAIAEAIGPGDPAKRLAANRKNVACVQHSLARGESRRQKQVFVDSVEVGCTAMNATLLWAWRRAAPSLPARPIVEDRQCHAIKT